jgi:hypothetical protein
MWQPLSTLSATLFIMCLNPLLNALEKNLTGINTDQRGMKMTIIAYADDVMIIVSKA